MGFFPATLILLVDSTVCIIFVKKKSTLIFCIELNLTFCAPRAALIGCAPRAALIGCVQNAIASHESNGLDIIIALILNDINPLGKNRIDLVLELKVRP